MASMAQAKPQANGMSFELLKACPMNRGIINKASNAKQGTLTEPNRLPKRHTATRVNSATRPISAWRISYLKLGCAAIRRGGQPLEQRAVVEQVAYSLHFVPALVALVALGARTAMRSLVVVFALVAILFGAFNNLVQFDRAATFLEDHAELHHDVKSAREARPDDHWPRRGGEILAWPDTRGYFQGWHATGGSFSPGLDSFGLSIWVVDDTGAVITTGDTLSPETIREERRGDDDTAALAFATETPFYRATWEATGPREWTLELEPVDGARLAVAVRSVGPQKGPVRSVEWTGEALLVNDRHRIAVTPAAGAHVGEEGGAGWLRARSETRRVESRGGWAWARLDVPRAGATLVLSDPEERGLIDRRLFELDGSR